MRQHLREKKGENCKSV